MASEIPRHLLWDASAHRVFIPEEQLSEYSGAQAQLHWLTLHGDALYSRFVLMIRYEDDLGNVVLFPGCLWRLEAFSQHSFLRELCDTFLMESSARKKFVFPGDKANKLNPFFVPYRENYVNYPPFLRQHLTL